MLIINNTNADTRDYSAAIAQAARDGALPDELSGIFTLTKVDGYDDRWVLDWA